MNKEILNAFRLEGTVAEVKPLGNGLINDTYKVTTAEADRPDYVLQRINTNIFTDVEMLQRNIELVTGHIRKKMGLAPPSAPQKGATNVSEHDTNEAPFLGAVGGATSRHVLHFIPTHDGKTYHRDAAGQCWRVSVFIPNAVTLDEVTPETSYQAGRAFGEFEQMLSDLPEPLGCIIPDFHNMEFRMEQLREAVKEDPLGRVRQVQDILNLYERDADRMCQGERLFREGKLPRRICHCDTKVNNMMFDATTGEFLLVIDLDTVMPSLFFSDYGDFLRTAANTTAEDDPNLDNVHFREDIFRSFTRGYVESVRPFFTPLEIQLLPYAVELFPFMQSVRFMWAYILGNDYWKWNYPEHNLDRARNQLRLYQEVCRHEPMMKNFIHQIISVL